MREIKFRAWRKTLGMMMRWDDLKNWLVPLGDDIDHILMQYTGLKDKQGKEIYEGDVIRVRRPMIKGQRIVEFNLGSFVMQRKVSTSHEPFDSNTEGPCAQYNDIEVIGNIYENPELIKER